MSHRGPDPGSLNNGRIPFIACQGGRACLVGRKRRHLRLLRPLLAAMSQAGCSKSLDMLEAKRLAGRLKKIGTIGHHALHGDCAQGGMAALLKSLPRSTSTSGLSGFASSILSAGSRQKRLGRLAALFGGFLASWSALSIFTNVLHSHIDLLPHFEEFRDIFLGELTWK